MMSGGWVPGGIWRMEVCETAVICAIGDVHFAPGWKKILVMLVPLTVCDSMCSMSSDGGGQHAFVHAGQCAFHLLGVQAGVVPQGPRPPGYSTLGKMSVGVRRITTGLKMRIRAPTR